LNDNAQTQPNRFVAGILYNQVCNKYSDKSNQWSLDLSLSVDESTVGVISSSPDRQTHNDGIYHASIASHGKISYAATCQNL